METNLTMEEIIEGQEMFVHFISDDFNKQLLINTIDNCVKGTDWPMSYYNLRSEYLPGLMGDEAAKYFFWLAFGGYFKQKIEFDIKEISLINFITYNYSSAFIRAKKYNINPLGFDSINFTHGPENDRFNLYLKRNDNSQFLLRTDPLEFVDMVTQSLEYFEEMLSSDVLEYEDKKEEILSNIESMKYFLIRIEDVVSTKGKVNG